MSTKYRLPAQLHWAKTHEARTISLRQLSFLLRRPTYVYRKVFTALHLCRAFLATCEMSICLSVGYVCPSVCQTRELWQNERKPCPHSYTTWKNIYPHLGASQIGDKPYRWQVNSVTVNSVTLNRWQVSVSSVTVIIYRQTTFSDPVHLACAYISQNIL